MTHDKRRGSCAKSPIKPLRPADAKHDVITPLVMEESLEKKIDNIGIVFCLIDDKDIFKKYYAKYLAKRLIKGSCQR
jgi:hypothetical protein